MRMQEQGLGAAVVKVVGVLLLGFLGCTRTLERPAPHAKAGCPCNGHPALLLINKYANLFLAISG